jgi:hypothetical protein
LVIGELGIALLMDVDLSHQRGTSAEKPAVMAAGEELE